MRRSRYCVSIESDGLAASEKVSICNRLIFFAKMQFGKNKLKVGAPWHPSRKTDN
jgi:hypothetical protein